jgi:hypothetical protein
MPGPPRDRSPVAASECSRAAVPSRCSILTLTTTHSRSTLPRTTASGEPCLRREIGSENGSRGTGLRRGAASGFPSGGWTRPSSSGRYIPPTSIPPRPPAPAGPVPGLKTTRSQIPTREASGSPRCSGRQVRPARRLRFGPAHRLCCRTGSIALPSLRGASRPASRGRPACRRLARAGLGQAKPGLRPARPDRGQAAGCPPRS